MPRKKRGPALAPSATSPTPEPLPSWCRASTANLRPVEGGYARHRRGAQEAQPMPADAGQ
eukprot:8973546-Alexandrium_andersonii.AAC.1